MKHNQITLEQDWVYHKGLPYARVKPEGKTMVIYSVIQQTNRQAFEDFKTYCKQKGFDEIYAEFPNTPYEDDLQEIVADWLIDHGFTIEAPEMIVLGRLNLKATTDEAVTA